MLLHNDIIEVISKSGLVEGGVHVRFLEERPLNGGRELMVEIQAGYHCGDRESASPSELQLAQLLVQVVAESKALDGHNSNIFASVKIHK